LEKVLKLRGLRGFGVNLFGCGWKQRYESQQRLDPAAHKDDLHLL
jgi:hypothetical protein